MTAFLNEGLDPPAPVIEAMSSVTVGTVLRMDPALLGAVRFEHARDEVARGELLRVSVAPTLPLPSLGLFTRRGALERPLLIQEFARVIRRAGAGISPAERLTRPVRQRRSPT